MNTRELKIGNYVTIAHESNSPIGVVKNVMEDEAWIKHSNKNHMVTDSLILPIRVTEQWLLNFGFEKTIEKHYDGCFWDFGDEFGLTQSKNGLYWFYFGDVPVQYVHQLQNLFFAMCGKELELKKEKV